MLRLFLLLFCLLCAALQVNANDVRVDVRVTAAFSKQDIGNQFYVELARLALSKGADGRTVPNIVPTVSMNQARALKELEKGTLDLLWIGTDIDKEKHFRAIRIPLHMGLMGFRRFIINEQDRDKFTAINSLSGLRQLMACQGTHWPDTKILKAAGLNVLSTSIHENLYEHLGKGRCDYFPRGFHEAPAEVKQWKAKFPSFKVYNGLILHYPFTIYFFTTKQNEKLAKWVEDGLEKMIDDGELLAFMQQHSYTAHIFPLHRFQSSTFIELKNPWLPLDTPIKDPRYWLSADWFKRSPQ